MVLVVGLGNPGRAYEGNRHNVGFMAADGLRSSENLPEYREKFSGLWTKGETKGDAFALLKPMTFMNLSGDSVQPATAFLKVESGSLVVIHDELDVPFGEVRLKLGGGHAGHNGLRSIIERLGSPEFIRVRVGIGRPPPGFRGDVADYVLHNFDPSEKAELPGVLDKAMSATRLIIKDGIKAAMAVVNQKTPVRNSGKKAPESP